MLSRIEMREEAGRETGETVTQYIIPIVRMYGVASLVATLGGDITDASDFRAIRAINAISDGLPIIARTIEDTGTKSELGSSSLAMRHQQLIHIEKATVIACAKL